MVNASLIEVGFDNSNVAGIVGGTGAANQAAAKAVTTGLELSIDLADIGSPTGASTVRVMVLQNNDNHDFLSNQTLGGLPVGTANLGSPASGVDFTLFPTTDQFFLVSIPEPATLFLVGFALVGGLLSARRRD